MSIERRTSGGAVVKISSDRAFNEPFVDMLVELNWGGGRILREYTFLLDPAGNVRHESCATNHRTVRALASCAGGCAIYVFLVFVGRFHSPCCGNSADATRKQSCKSCSSQNRGSSGNQASDGKVRRLHCACRRHGFVDCDTAQACRSDARSDDGGAVPEQSIGIRRRQYQSPAYRPDPENPVARRCCQDRQGRSASDHRQGVEFRCLEAGSWRSSGQGPRQGNQCVSGRQRKSSAEGRRQGREQCTNERSAENQQSAWRQSGRYYRWRAKLPAVSRPSKKMSLRGTRRCRKPSHGRPSSSATSRNSKSLCR